MSSVGSEKGNRASPKPVVEQLEWLPAAIGLAILYIPTFINLSESMWPVEDYSHGPLILAVVVWLAWQARDRWLSVQARPAPKSGWPLLVFGLLLYVFGRSQDVVMVEVGSMIPVLAGTMLLMRGWPATRAVWFALLFIIFMVPLPGVILDAMTAPLKKNVSSVAEVILYAGGYPIARSGVTLTIGQYQLLVADACSGLNSMFSLTALGLLYLHIMQHAARWRNALMILSILPIAFAANIVRVMFLVLVTYHFGDEAGQGFVHGFAGMILFTAALIILFSFDSLLGLLDRRLPSR